MKNKDSILKFVISILLVIFGVLLLLDQLNVPFIDDFFTPWYTIVLLFFAACLLAYAIVKKAPVFYILSMLIAGIYLVISINAKIEEMAVGKFIAIIPLFVGIGTVIADKICKWSPKAMRFGIVLSIASAVILVSTILDVWKYVIPIVIILIGIAYIIFGVFAIKHDTKRVEDDHYVTYEPKDKVDEVEKQENQATDTTEK